MASFDEWLVAFDQVYRSLPDIEEVACPNCAHPTLRLVFTARPGADVGYAAFWCDNCLQGIHLSRTVVPEGVEVRDASVPIGERLPAIPDYNAVD